MDESSAYLPGRAEMNPDGEVGRLNRLRQRKFLSKIVEQDRRHLKRLVTPELGFDSFYTARRALAGYGSTSIIKEAQIHKVGGRDMLPQAILVAKRSEGQLSQHVL